MTEQNSSDERFRFSLKWLLILLLVLGAGLGLLGKLFYIDRDSFRVVVLGLTTVVPFLLAVGTLVWMGRRRGRRALAAWGGLLLAMPFGGYGAIFLAQRAAPTPTMRASPANIQNFTTGQLIAQRLPQQMDEPWVWRELESRLSAGKLSKEHAEGAIKQLVAHMKQKSPDGWDQPLHWQDGFVQRASAAGLLSDEVRIALWDAFYGTTPKLRPLPRLRESSSGFDLEVDFGNTWGRSSGIDVALVWDVTRVTLDGERLDVRQTNLFAGSWSGHCDERLPAGEHELAVEIECAYIDRRKLIGLNENDLPKEPWPAPLKRWRTTVSAPLRVYADEEPIIALSTDPDQNPRRHGGITVERLVVQSGDEGRARIVVKLEAAPTVSMPVSADVAVRLGGQTVEMGSSWFVRLGNSSASGGAQLEKSIEGLHADVTTADVILTPNPAPIEQRSDVKEIWGKPIVLPGLPLERLDLEARENVP